MLVLTRKVNDRILIGENITITVTKIDGNQVRIGIEAPPEVLIRRAELLQQWEVASDRAPEPAPKVERRTSRAPFAK